MKMRIPSNSLIKSWFFSLLMIWLVTLLAPDAITAATKGSTCPKPLMDEYLPNMDQGFIWGSETKDGRVFKQRMDSMVQQNWAATSQWTNSLKENYTYDAQGNILVYDKSVYVTTNQSIVTWKETYLYNPSGKISQLTLMTWDSLTNQLGNSWKEAYTYDAGGNIVLYQAYSWSKTLSAWVNSWKAEYIYDINARLSLYNDYYWNAGSNLWVNSWKAEYFYNAAGLISLYQDYYYNTGNGQWVKSWKAEYSYNTLNNITLYQEFSWSTATSLWVNSAKKEYTYNLAGLQESVTQYTWKTSNSQWIYFRKEDFSYNAAGKFSLHQLFVANQSGNQWVNSWKAERIYSASDFLVSQMEYNWNATTSQWNYSVKKEFTVDSGYVFPDIIMPFWYQDNDFFLAAMLLQYKELQYVNSAWADATKIDYFYTDLNPIGYDEWSNKPFLVFPNPAHHTLNVQGDGNVNGLIFRLYDLAGGLVLQQTLSQSGQIGLEGIPGGIYIYSIMGERLEGSGKLLID